MKYSIKRSVLYHFICSTVFCHSLTRKQHVERKLQMNKKKKNSVRIIEESLPKPNQARRIGILLLFRWRLPIFSTRQQRSFPPSSQLLLYFLDWWKWLFVSSHTANTNRFMRVISCTGRDDFGFGTVLHPSGVPHEITIYPQPIGWCLFVRVINPFIWWATPWRTTVSF